MTLQVTSQPRSDGGLRVSRIRAVIWGMANVVMIAGTALLWPQRPEELLRRSWPLFQLLATCVPLVLPLIAIAVFLYSQSTIDLSTSPVGIRKLISSWSFRVVLWGGVILDAILLLVPLLLQGEAFSLLRQLQSTGMVLIFFSAPLVLVLNLIAMIRDEGGLRDWPVSLHVHVVGLLSCLLSCQSEYIASYSLLVMLVGSVLTGVEVFQTKKGARPVLWGLAIINALVYYMFVSTLETVKGV